MRPLAAYLRSLNPRLPRSIVTLQVGALVNFFGNGVVLPFLFIYLHNVRGISLQTSGLILAANGAASLVATPVAGSLVDRVGGRVILGVSLVLLAAGYAQYPFVHEPWQGFLASAVAGAGTGTFWPAQSALLAGLASPAERPAAFAMQRMAMNLGFGLGGLFGGLVATTSEPSTFTIIFLVDAATFVVYLGALALVPEPRRAESGERVPGRWLDVVRNRTFMAIVALNFVFITAGMVQLDVFPVYAKNEASVTERMIGVVFFVNTLVVFLAQLPITKLLEGRRRMPAYALLGAVSAAAWLLFPIAGVFLSGVEAAALITGAVAIFAVGECLHGAVHAPLVADLADDRLLGRYMASSSASWQVAFTVGPAFAGFVLAREPHLLWVLAAAACVGAGVIALALESSLPRDARRSPVRMEAALSAE